jgi:hypothetical protein
MQTSRPLLGRYALLTALGLTDLALTCYLLRASSGHIYESNPLAQWSLARGGWGGLVTFKLALLGLAMAVIAWVGRCRPAVAARVLTFSCLATLAVIVYSCSLLRSIPRHGVRPLRDLATLAAEGRGFDEQLRQLKAYRLVLSQAAEELLAGRSTLDEAVARLAATKHGQDPAWLNHLRRRYPGRSDLGCLAATLLDHARGLREVRSAEQDAAGATHRPRVVSLPTRGVPGAAPPEGMTIRRTAAEALGPLPGSGRVTDARPGDSRRRGDESERSQLAGPVGTPGPFQASPTGDRFRSGG